MYMDMCRVFRGTDMDFRIFFDKILTDVSFLSLSITYVPIVIQNKIHWTKIKAFKPQRQKSIKPQILIK
jgi:hypothetical protein